MRLIIVVGITVVQDLVKLSSCEKFCTKPNYVVNDCDTNVYEFFSHRGIKTEIKQTAEC